jgi:hypothetical protein
MAPPGWSTGSANDTSGAAANAIGLWSIFPLAGEMVRTHHAADASEAWNEAGDGRTLDALNG